MPLSPGESVGRFEVVREIGRGGFGVVYEARDTELGRSVAFKAIRASGADAAREARLFGEAEAAARLAHPNIVHLYDVGRSEQGAFLIMELLRGKTLAERLRDGPLALREAVRVAVEVSRGLAHAHSQGVVHRDLKPSNVFLCDDGQVKVLDFGLAHVFGRGGAAGGTPGYMAPEQEKGETGDERSDVYSLGVLAREMLTGKLPVSSPSPTTDLTDASPLSTAAAGERGQPAAGEKARPTPTPAEVRGRKLASVPSLLARLVQRMLTADPAARPADGVEAHRALLAVQKSLQPRRLLWASLAIATAALVGAGLFAYFWQRPLPPGRLLAAIADTENASGERDLDGVSELLRTALESSPRLSIVARSRLVNVLREAGPLPRSIDALGARRAALAAGVRILIVPAVRHADLEYQLTAAVVDLAGGETTYTARETTATTAGLREAVERLSARIRAALHDDAKPGAATSPSLLQVAPVNPAAWARYADGQRLESEGRGEAARDAYLEAVALTPRRISTGARARGISRRAWRGSSVPRTAGPRTPGRTARSSG
ncbi:MAG TPA: serine/threonine-protein kinase [Anaeromyxobacteraceae bacterium]|nr:serine/threonine-protein kinase [Anaeromyxobacteraceae bacterium]